MKGTSDSPQCGFSMAVSNALKHLNVNFKGIDVLKDENLDDQKRFIANQKIDVLNRLN